MTLKGPEFKKALLLGLVVAAVPLLYYPGTFGWAGAASGGALLFAVEVAYYLLTYQFLLSREPMANRVKATATSLAFRLCLGIVFAFLAGGIFNLGAAAAVSAGVYGYLPAALLHMAIVPYLLKPVFRFRELKKQRPAPQAESAPSRTQRNASSPGDTPSWTAADHLPDFEAAVEHVASYSTVGLVILVDDEGLCVARASRGTADSELWAPVVNLLYDSAIHQLARTGDTDVRGIQVTLSRERLVIERVEPFYLAVLFDHNTDELVNVRIAQAVEMVKRYYEHKYRKVAREAATEVAHV